MNKTNGKGKEGPPTTSLQKGRIEAGVWKALSEVVDPELHYNIVDLGLVYRVQTQPDGDVLVTVTLTSPGCPYGPYLMHEIRVAAESVKGVKKAKIDLVWEPPWGPMLMSEEARLDLGFDV
jgi:metal-sulfur cluster biosynthetic enzyme